MRPREGDGGLEAGPETSAEAGLEALGLSSPM